MSKNGRNSLWISLLSGLLLTVLAGCATELTETREMTSVSMAPRDDLQKMGISTIYREKKRVGTIEQYRQLDGDNNDANDRSLWIVLDGDGQRLGYLTDDLRAYRFQAHGDPELVANHPKMANDVMAIFGWFDGTIEMERQVVKE